MMRRGKLISVVWSVGLLFWAARAQAGGLEYTATGSRALGRGGAVTARADDPMVLAYNPAGLAELRGNQFLLDLNLAVMNACFDPYGYYGWGAYGGGRASHLPDPNGGAGEDILLGNSNPPHPSAAAYYDDPLDTVCFDQSYVPIPQLVFTSRITERLGVGFGLLFPAMQPQGRWGGEHGVIRGASGHLRPSPGRYMLLGSNNIGLFPTLGVGYRLTDAIRIGGAVEWGMIAVENRTMGAQSGGTSPAGDVEARVTGVDWFVPAATLSVHVVPTDAWDIVLAARYQDDVRARGTVRATTGIFDPGLMPHTTSLPIDEIHQPMPWKLRAGVRYAKRLRPRPEGTGQDEGGAWQDQPVHDALEDEQWDIELDVEYQMNSRLQQQVLDYGEFSTVTLMGTDGSTGTAPFPRTHPGENDPNPDQPTHVIQKRWRDQISVRLGGTYNVLPGRFAVSLGAHYENRGIDANYMQLDFWPLSRVGLHTGIILRLSRIVDLNISYAHIFQETLIVEPPPHMTRGEIYDAQDPRSPQNIDQRVGAPVSRSEPAPVRSVTPSGTPDGQAQLPQQVSQMSGNEPAYITNAGRYRSSFHIVSAGLNFHF